jgi:glycosyltransferase involved in cell wall biosynthesis
VTDAGPTRVSVIVAARNAAHELPLMLDALHQQSAAPGSFEVLVVDDGSTDATAAVIRNDPLAQLVEVPEARGPYPARNVAARGARGDLLAFTDADCVPAADWIARGLQRFEDPAVDMLGGEIRIPLGRRPSAVALIDAGRHLDQEVYFTRGYGATANMWVRRSVFESVGGFNDRILSGGDREFGNRAIVAGHRLVYAPETIVDHPPRTRLRELARKGFRIGKGSAHALAYADGPLGRGRPVWMDPRNYLPPRELTGVHRLERAGHAPGRLKTLHLLLAQYLCLTLPVVTGSIVGEVEVRRRRGG